MWEEWGRTVRIRCGLNPDQLQRCVCFQVIMYVKAVLTGVNFIKWISHRPGWTKMGSMKNATLLNLRPFGRSSLPKPTPITERPDRAARPSRPPSPSFVAILHLWHLKHPPGVDIGWGDAAPRIQRTPLNLSFGTKKQDVHYNTIYSIYIIYIYI